MDGFDVLHRGLILFTLVEELSEFIVGQFCCYLTTVPAYEGRGLEFPIQASSQRRHCERSDVLLLRLLESEASRSFKCWYPPIWKPWKGNLQTFGNQIWQDDDRGHKVAATAGLFDRTSVEGRSGYSQHSNFRINI